MSKPHPLVELTRARLLEFLREPEAVFWVFVFPVLLAIALGIAFRSQGPSVAPVGVTGTTASRADEVATLLVHAGAIGVRRLAAPEAEAALASGNLDVLVQVPDDRGQPIIYRFDPTRPEGRVARGLVDDALQRQSGRQDAVAVRDEHVAAVGSRYIDFLIPGLVGLNLMGSGMWGLGFAVVQARVRKLLKRFAATPMRRSHFLLSFMLSRLGLLAGEVVAVVGAGWVLFGVTVRGRIADLAVVSLLGAFTFAGLGLLVAARSRTIEGVSGWMNLVQLPMWLLSGSFFSYARFPEAVQPAIRLLPLTALNDALRAVTNRGVSLAATWPEIAVMVAWGGLSFVLALRLFRWQ
ncbi:MAG: ABC transporter permease [Thermoanaerobaculaceae bacterium]